MGFLFRNSVQPMPWIEAFHIIFVVTWFAGLFYLPRLFVYAAENPGGPSFALLQVMQRRLLGITHIGGALAVGFGLTLVSLVQRSPGAVSGADRDSGCREAFLTGAR